MSDVREVAAAVRGAFDHGLPQALSDARLHSVSIGKDGPGWIAAIPDAVLMGSAASSMMHAMGWTARHRVEASNPGNPASPVVDLLRDAPGPTYRSDVLGEWGGLRSTTMTEALARVEAAFVAGEEEVLAQAAAVHLRRMGWTVAEPGHMHVWDQHGDERAFIENRWSCRCGARKDDEGMPR